MEKRERKSDSCGNHGHVEEAGWWKIRWYGVEFLHGVLVRCCGTQFRALLDTLKVWQGHGGARVDSLAIESVAKHLIDL